MPNNDLLIDVLSILEENQNTPLSAASGLVGYTQEQINEAYLHAYDNGFIEGLISNPMAGGRIVRPLRITANGIAHLARLKSQ